MTPDSGAGGIEVLVEGGDWGFGPADAAGLAREAAEAALAAADARGGLAILLADDARLADLNAAFRSKTGPTNVLSFPAPPIPGAGWVMSPWPSRPAGGRPRPRTSALSITCNISWRTASCIL